MQGVSAAVSAQTTSVIFGLVTVAVVFLMAGLVPVLAGAAQGVAYSLGLRREPPSRFVDLRALADRARSRLRGA
jgi:hypothetical protein